MTDRSVSTVEDAERDGDGTPRAAPQPELLPLNSRRLTTPLVRQLATALGLPVGASTADVRQMIDGKLIAEGREPRNVQVRISTFELGGQLLELQDAGGVFLEAMPVPPSMVEPGGDEETTETVSDDIGELREALHSAEEERETLKQAAESSNKRLGEVWSISCRQLADFEATVSCKDEEIKTLQEKVADLERQLREPRATTIVSPALPTVLRTPLTVRTTRTARSGKAPPIDPYSGDSYELLLDDWLPSLNRAAEWNGWSEDEKLLQLAGHLRGRAHQEWSLVDDKEKTTYDSAVKALRARLDQGGKVLAAQDFRHLSQSDRESVTEFVRRLERTFRVAYGRDSMSPETRDALLYSQLQESLRQDIMNGPAVSGAQSYAELCIAAKNEERRIAGLRKREGYRRTGPGSRPSTNHGDKRSEPLLSSQSHGHGSSRWSNSSAARGPPQDTRRCNTCHKIGHIARDCRSRTESRGPPPGDKSRHPQTRRVGTEPGASPPTDDELESPLDLLYSSSDEDANAHHVRRIQIADKGSQPRCARVLVQGVPAFGIVDSGADITIIGGELFKKVAAGAKLKKRDFKKPDKVPRTYNRQPFTLNGRMDLTIEFDDKVITTPVYIKMDAFDQLLLSEGVCRQLGILSYHPKVEVWRDRKKSPTAGPDERKETEALIPMVTVRLVESVHLASYHGVVVPVEFVGQNLDPTQSFCMETSSFGSSLSVKDTLIRPDSKGRAYIAVENSTGYTEVLAEGTDVGMASPVSVVECEEYSSDSVIVNTVRTEKQNMERKAQLMEYVSIECPEVTDEEEKRELLDVITDFHEAFSLSGTDRGETDLVELQIDTGDARPRKLPVRRMPFAVREEVARQVQEMQEIGVISPSKSPWSSPVVLVRKKDGSHRFCIDYRELNSVTKADTFPLPRIDDMLDQLGQCKYFSTLDLAAGFWQIRVQHESAEKTAFSTPQGLFEFRVMPFGLTNAPAVFQRLIQQVISGLNPVKGPDFVAAYIDDIIVFSATLEEHIAHLETVLARIIQTGLKLKPSKCRFVRKEVEYLGHLITPDGLKANPRLVAAVKDFPVPQNLLEVRRFLGMCSYYRRFITHFSSIARPLHLLTRKGAEFKWTTDCEGASDLLKEKLTSAPVLAYPLFDRPFVLETDASGGGLGAVLCQIQDDSLNHPIAYASRSLSRAEENYSITELETLAVVWAVSNFRTYLYAHDVTVYTDNSAVRAVLETPNPSGKHARWWSKVYESGLRSIRIIYRSGKSNVNADALSRNPTDAPSREVDEDVQITVVQSDLLFQESSSILSEKDEDTQIAVVQSNISDLLSQEPDSIPREKFPDFALEQRQDPSIGELIAFLEEDKLPTDDVRARKLSVQSTMFTVLDGVVYYIDHKPDVRKRAVVPQHLQRQIVQESHEGPLGGHFSGARVYKMLIRHWWWEGMYADVCQYCKSYPVCAIATGGSRPGKPTLSPIPVSRPFQIMGVDIMELPLTSQGNKYVIVFQDLFTKWPFVFAMPDQKSSRLVRLLVEEIIPTFGVPEALLSDRGTNLLSHLMLDVCKLLGVRKLNTTAYHPQCDGAVERFNRTLKTMLRKQAAKMGNQWDRYLSGVLWAYRNTPHESTREKPSFLLFGLDCRSPTEACLLPPSAVQYAETDDYREELMLSLSSARQLASTTLREAQKRYKHAYDRRARSGQYHVGDWILIRFPQEESGKDRKLSRPWHGPYRILTCSNPDVVACKVYFPEDSQIQIHQMRTTMCPPGFHNGFYWYGKKQTSPGHYPKWTENIGFDNEQDNTLPDVDSAPDTPDVTDIADPDTDTSQVESTNASDITSPTELSGSDIRAPQSSDGDIADQNEQPVRDRHADSSRYRFRDKIYRPKRYT